MAGIARKTAKVFGGSLSATNNIAVFGSLKAASPAFSLDPAAIQSAAWLLGWGDAVVTVGGNPNVPPLQDVNAVEFVLSQFIAYLLTRGIPEYDAGTGYNLYDIAKVNGVVYVSLQDANTAHTPASSPTWWAEQQSGSYPAGANNTGQTLTADGNGHIVNYATELFDPNAAYNPATYKYTAPTAGIYDVAANLQVDNVNCVAASVEFSMRIVKNSASVLISAGVSVPTPAGGRWYPAVAGLVSLAAGDTLEIQLEANDGVGTNTATLSNGSLSIHRVRAT